MTAVDLSHYVTTNKAGIAHIDLAVEGMGCAACIGKVEDNLKGMAGVTEALAKAKVNITALALMDSGEHGTLRIICDDAEKTRKVLGKAHDRWTESDVLVVELKNTPGAFAAVSQLLATEHINITYAYCTGGAPGGRTTAVFKLADLKKAERVLLKASTKSKRKRTSQTVRKSPGTRK